MTDEVLADPTAAADTAVAVPSAPDFINDPLYAQMQARFQTVQNGAYGRLEQILAEVRYLINL